MTISVFISYEHSAKNLIIELVDKLEAAKFRVFWDDDIEIGSEDYRVKIDDLIKEADILLLYLTDKSTKSAYVTYEWGFAKGLGKPIFILLDKDVQTEKIHPRLSTTQHLKFDHNWQEILDELRKIEIAPPSALVPRENIVEFAKEMLAADVLGTRHLQQLEKYELLDGKSSRELRVWYVDNFG